MLRWDVSFLPGGRGKGLDNKTRRMSLAADVWDVQDEMLSQRHKHRKHYHSTFQQERETLSASDFTIRGKRKIKKRNQMLPDYR